MQAVRVIATILVCLMMIMFVGAMVVRKDEKDTLIIAVVLEMIYALCLVAMWG